MFTVVVAAYHPLVLQGINQIVYEKHNTGKIVGQTTTVKGLITLIRNHNPTVAIVDVGITWNSNIDIIEEIRKINPSIELHFLNVHPADRSVRDYLENKSIKYLKINVGKYINKDDLANFPDLKLVEIED
jgi:DNA-binding NarL/FixJ family response regulator